MITSDRQHTILTVMREWIEQHGYPPTVREIGASVGLAPSSVDHHLKALERQGLLRREARGPRAVDIRRVVPDVAIDVPLVGAIAAGRPILAEENIEDYVPVPELAGGAVGEYLLRIRGDSMKDAGILEGDYVVVRPQDTARNGDIVVALLGEEATVKRFFREDGHVRLQPENDAMEPIRSTEVKLLGRVVGLLRSI